MRSFFNFLLSFIFLISLAACSDPPPPSKRSVDLSNARSNLLSLFISPMTGKNSFDTLKHWECSGPTITKNGKNFIECSVIFKNNPLGVRRLHCSTEKNKGCDVL